MTSAADELEFYAVVDTKFRQELKVQNKQFVFAASKATKSQTMLKPSDWTTGNFG